MTVDSGADISVLLEEFATHSEDVHVPAEAGAACPACGRMRLWEHDAAAGTGRLTCGCPLASWASPPPLDMGLSMLSNVDMPPVRPAHVHASDSEPGPRPSMQGTPVPTPLPPLPPPQLQRSQRQLSQRLRLSSSSNNCHNHGNSCRYHGNSSRNSGGVSASTRSTGDDSPSSRRTSSSRASSASSARLRRGRSHSQGSRNTAWSHVALGSGYSPRPDEGQPTMPLGPGSTTRFLLPRMLLHRSPGVRELPKHKWIARLAAFNGRWTLTAEVARVPLDDGRASLLFVRVMQLVARAAVFRDAARALGLGRMVALHSPRSSAPHPRLARQHPVPLDSCRMRPLPHKHTPRCTECCACHDFGNGIAKVLRLPQFRNGIAKVLRLPRFRTPPATRATTSCPSRQLPNATPATQSHTQMHRMLRLPRLRQRHRQSAAPATISQRHRQSAAPATISHTPRRARDNILSL